MSFRSDTERRALFHRVLAKAQLDSRQVCGFSPLPRFTPHHTLTRARARTHMHACFVRPRLSSGMATARLGEVKRAVLPRTLELGWSRIAPLSAWLPGGGWGWGGGGASRRRAGLAAASRRDEQLQRACNGRAGLGFCCWQAVLCCCCCCVWALAKFGASRGVYDAMARRAATYSGRAARSSSKPPRAAQQQCSWRQTLAGCTCRALLLRDRRAQRSSSLC